VAVTERLLDVSDLEPPEPLQKALAVLDTLGPGEYLRFWHRRAPELLYPILDKRGFQHHTHRGPRTPVEVLIWRCGDSEAEAACRALIPAPKAPMVAGSVQAF